MNKMKHAVARNEHYSDSNLACICSIYEAKMIKTKMTQLFLGHVMSYKITNRRHLRIQIRCTVFMFKLLS